MKNFKLSLLALLAVATALISSCGSSTPTPEPPKEKTISDEIKTTWSASIVTENSTVVYDKSKTTNAKDGYKNFKMSLGSISAASITLIDGVTYNGSYTLSGSKLTFSGLTPVPTGTGGTIEFNIVKKSDTNLEFTRTSADAKTGNSTNVYNMVTP